MLKRTFARFALLSALIPVLVHAAPGDALLQDVQKRLVDAPVIRGDFVQERQLVGVKKTLTANGHFVVEKKRGVVWHTVKPFDQRLQVARDEIVQKDGKETLMKLTADKEPVVRTVGGVLFSLFSGDLSGLAKHFDVSGNAKGPRWNLLLSPKDASMAKLIGNLKLAGDKTIESVEMNAASGDVTRIRMSKVTTATQMSAEDEADFD
ncbi:outer membrane lipoprotein carrier protein LolA [Jeongeupia wiesaeckerbachi]|uniref:LolA family protein n=1 Tax=Jeongeupia wiesaeckerbachi TaxID=3051218 RepID=UPI003D80698C